MNSNNRTNGWWTVGCWALLIAWVSVIAGPELFRDRISPFDAALHAANGALFFTLYTELSDFLRAPLEWLWSYYDQYPALSLRRHPPVLGATIGVVYLFTGIGPFGARLTILLFSTVFAIAAYFLGRNLWGDRKLALAAALMLVSVPTISDYFRSVWADIPALAMALLALAFYARRLVSNDRRTGVLVAIATCSLVSIYTYQITIVLLATMALHLVVVERRTILKDKALILTALASMIAAIPLLAQAWFVGQDNLAAIVGSAPQDWMRFAAVENRFSFENWTYYWKMLDQRFIFHIVGFVLWVGIRSWRKPASAEWFFFACTIVSYLAFGWLMAKNPRYAMYIAIPLSVVAVYGYKELVRLIVSGRWEHSQKVVLPLLLVTFAIVQVVAVSSRPEYVYLSGMRAPAAAMLGASSDPSILYSGHQDAAFVFYLRSIDSERRARVFRATVQVQRASDLDDFLVNQEIDYVAYEATDVIGTPAAYGEFRAVLVAILANNSRYEKIGVFDLKHGLDSITGTVPLVVYRRRW